MAKLKIKSIELIAPRSRKSQIIDYLQRKGAVELSVPPETDGLTYEQFSEQKTETEQKLAAVSAGMDILNRAIPQKKPLTAMLEPRKELSDTDVKAQKAALDETVQACLHLSALDKEAAQLQADNIRLQTFKESLLPWKNEQNTVRAGHTERTAFMSGLFRDKRDYEQLLTELASRLPDRDCVDAEILSAQEDMTCVTVYCLRDDAEEVFEALRSMGFIPAPETPGRTPAEVLRETQEKIDENNARIEAINNELAASGALFEKTEAAEDLLTVRLDKLSALEKIPQTQRVFYLQGYAAAKDAEKLKKYVETHYEAAMEIKEPAEDEDVPVLLTNGFFASPLENITGMYSLPSKADIDPTPFMAFFYYFFFGMMLSDAGYGQLIALATGGLLLFKRNMEEKKKRSLRMYFFCGLSTVFWGAMYGSWFGDAGSVICREFLHMENFNPLPPIWTDAVTDTMNVLILCFILGLAHLFWGVCMKGYTDIKNGHRLDAVFDTIPTFLTVIGIAPIFFGLFVQDSIPDDYSALGTVLYNTFMSVHGALEKVYVYILLAGLILVILTAGRHSKSIGGKLGGGLYGVYNLFSGYLGDVLSYARLLALGMATGVIGQVMNMLGTLPKNPIIKVIAFILVFVAGHTANLAINIIGAYVHTNRLQYVEFFSKFYEGGGRAFVPFEASTKYYRFKEEQ